MLVLLAAQLSSLSMAATGRRGRNVPLVYILKLYSSNSLHAVCASRFPAQSIMHARFLQCHPNPPNNSQTLLLVLTEGLSGDRTFTVHLCFFCPSFRMHVYFLSIFRIQNFQHSEIVHLFSMCIFIQFSE